MPNYELDEIAKMMRAIEKAEPLSSSRIQETLTGNYKVGILEF
jgi:hypothetical protein